jgi:hypothetical protein
MTVDELKLGEDVADTSKTSELAYRWNNLIYQQYETPYYTDTENQTVSNRKQITYTATPNNKIKNLATVSGLTAIQTLIDEGKVDFNPNSKTLTVNAAALGTANVAITTTEDGKAYNGDDAAFKLALGGDVATVAESKTEAWAVSGTTAVKKDYVKGYYTLNDAGTQIITTRDANPTKTYAKITGLKAGLTAADIEKLESESEVEAVGTEGQTGYVAAHKEITLTLGKDQLGTTNVVLDPGRDSGTTVYKLAIDTTSDKKVKASVVYEGAWSTNDKTKASSYIAHTAEYYTLNTDRNGKVTYKGITRHPAGANTTYLTIVGSDTAMDTARIDITDNGETTRPAKATISNEAFGNKNTVATVTAHATDMTLEFTATGTKKLVGSTGADTIVVKGSGVVDGGAAADNITVAATGATVYGGAGADTITVEATTGANSKVYGGADNDTITVNATNVTAYGDAGADNIIVAATGATVYGGAGNDTIDLGDVTATFVYTTGDGNDTIKKFTAGTDKFQLGSSTTTITSVTNDNGNLLVKIDGGTVTLTGAGTGLAAGATFSYYAYNAEGASTVAIDGLPSAGSGSAASSADLLFDDNLASGAELTISELVNTSMDNHSLDSLNATRQLNGIAEQNELVFAFAEEKKNNK